MMVSENRQRYLSRSFFVVSIHRSILLRWTTPPFFYRYLLAGFLRGAHAMYLFRFSLPWTQHVPSSQTNFMTSQTPLFDLSSPLPPPPYSSSDLPVDADVHVPTLPMTPAELASGLDANPSPDPRPSRAQRADAATAV